MRRFRGEDLDEMNSWYRARGRSALPIGLLPETGFFEPGVGAGFLYITDSETSLIEGYITNPIASLRARNRAINMITLALLAEAKRRGSSLVVAICRERGIERRANKFGLRTIGTYALASRSV